MSTQQDAAAVGIGDEETTDLHIGSDTDSDAAVPGSGLCADDVFHLLQNARRRGVLRYIREHPDAESFEMRDVAEQVAAWEQNKSVSTITSTERQRVYIALYQSHLPKLDEHGVVEYEQSRGTVRPTAVADDVSRYLDVENEPEAGADDAASESGGKNNRVTQYYGGATLLGGVLTAAAWVGVVPALLTSYVGTVVTALFAAVTLVVGMRRRPV